MTAVVLVGEIEWRWLLTQLGGLPFAREWWAT